jgi:hypothetical protein
MASCRAIGDVHRTLSHHYERRPVGRVRLVPFAGVDERQHRSPQGLCATDIGITGDVPGSGGDQLDRRIRGDRQCDTRTKYEDMLGLRAARLACSCRRNP